MELLMVESCSSAAAIVGTGAGTAVFVSATTVLLATLAVLTLTLVWLNGRKYQTNGQIGLFFRVKNKAERLIRSQLKSVPVVPPPSSTSSNSSTTPATLRKGPPPGPTGWPVIGSLHLLAKYEVPFEAFSELSKIYGDLFSITLGSTPCVVVNSFPLIKEVLITKGPHFGGRPNFIRYDILFGGDRDNCKFD